MHIVKCVKLAFRGKKRLQIVTEIMEFLTHVYHLPIMALIGS